MDPIENYVIVAAEILCKARDRGDFDPYTDKRSDSGIAFLRSRSDIILKYFLKMTSHISNKDIKRLEHEMLNTTMGEKKIMDLFYLYSLKDSISLIIGDDPI